MNKYVGKMEQEEYKELKRKKGATDGKGDWDVLVPSDKAPRSSSFSTKCPDSWSPKSSCRCF